MYQASEDEERAAGRTTFNVYARLRDAPVDRVGWAVRGALIRVVTSLGCVSAGAGVQKDVRRSGRSWGESDGVRTVHRTRALYGFERAAEMEGGRLPYERLAAVVHERAKKAR